jgi:hypothetical protein
VGRELGEKSQLIIATLTEATGPLDGDAVAVAIGDTDEGGAKRVKALLQNLKGKGLVHQPGRSLWAPGPAPDGALADADDDDTDGTPRRVHRDAAATAALLKQQRLAPAADARARNSGPRGPRQAAARIKVAPPKAAPPAMDAHEVAVSASGEVLVLSRDAVITRLSATVALQVAEAVRRLHQGA